MYFFQKSLLRQAAKHPFEEPDVHSHLLSHHPPLRNAFRCVHGLRMFSKIVQHTARENQLVLCVVLRVLGTLRQNELRYSRYAITGPNRLQITENSNKTT